jgi:hypothetical protein
VFDMPGDSQKQRFEYRYSDWGIRITTMEVGLRIGNPFPDEDGFYDSVWWLREDRIKTAHDLEEKQIQSRYQEWKNQIRNSDDPSFDPGEWAGDEYWETRRVTNSMYGALVVSIWSGIESFMKITLSVCSEALGKGKKGEDHDSKKLNVNEALKQLKKYGIPVEQCTKYTTANAVRLLNNSYKHDDGHYSPKAGKPHTQIDQAILSKWRILKGQNQDEIDYSKLPIQEIVIDCNSFCSDLLSKTKAVLVRHSAQSP